MKTALPGVLRLIAIILVVGGVVLGVLDAYGVAKLPISGEESLGSRLPLVVQAVAMALGMVGLGVLMYALAEMIESGPANNAAKEKETRQALSELHQSMQRLELAVQHVADQQKETATHGPANLGDLGVADTLAGGLIGSSESLHQIMTVLQELRELTLLSDNQRQELLADSKHLRRNHLAAEAQRLLDLKEWFAAESAIAALDSEFPESPDLETLKSRLVSGRQDAEQSAIDQLRERVEDLMAVWAWDQAYAETARFVEKFPEHKEGAELLQRVMTERENYIESTANRLYEEIRTDVDRRSYRRAMANSVKLLECAPGHRKSVAIRGQLKTIRENAEIEERQEQERRIQELIRNKQFFEAIDMAEDLLQRFPNSPQAETLQRLLPKMRELAIGNEAEV
jgi:outer membrane protein assembly factor BamD (BamD/ComL family)